MAKEIKTLNVDNDMEEALITLFPKFGWELKSSQRIYNQDSRSDGAITYEGVTFIHNTTDTMDFTKLVFEREKKMKNYDELVQLEKKYWKLLEDAPKSTPDLPPSVKNMEDWGKYFYPDLRSSEEKIRHNVIFGIILAVWGIFSLIYGSGAASNSTDGGTSAYIILFGAALIIFVWVKTYQYGRQKALKIALTPKSSSYRKELTEQYEAVMTQITAYKDSVAKMHAILTKAEELLD